MPIRRNGLTDRYKDLIKGGQRPGTPPPTQLGGEDPRVTIPPSPITPAQPLLPPPTVPESPRGTYFGPKPTDRETRPKGGPWTPTVIPGQPPTQPKPPLYQSPTPLPIGIIDQPLAPAHIPTPIPTPPGEPQIAGPGTPLPPGLGGDVNVMPAPQPRAPRTPVTPELEGTKYTGGGVGGGMTTPPTQVQPREFPSYGGDMTEWLNMLKQPITAQVGLGERERQQIYNQARGQIQGATRTGMEQMREMMGGRGFRAGESGIADTAIGGVAQAGRQGLQNVSQNIAISEAQNRFAQNMALNQANLQRMGVGGQMALGGRGQDIQRELGWGGLDVTQRGQDITQQLGQGQLGLGYAGLDVQRELGLGGLDLGWGGLDVQRELGQGQLGLGGQQLDWQKEMFGQTFPYQQEMDSLSMLMNLYGMQTQSQQYRFNPYWQSLLQ